MQYRHEWKAELNWGDLTLLRSRLEEVLRRDPHTGERGSYLIRSLYFDNGSDTALREKLDGVCHREKFRIRAYNHDYSRLKLEKKVKDNSLGYKLSAPMSYEECERILGGDWQWLLQSEKPLFRELGERMLHGGYRPRTIVEYIREPFIYEAGNVRVTLDYDLRTGIGGTDFLDPDCVTVPAGDTAALVEVKYDNFLPDPVRHAVQLGFRRTGAFSKYAACRKYG